MLIWSCCCWIVAASRPAWASSWCSLAVWLRASMSPVVQCQPSTNGLVTRWATLANGAVTWVTPFCTEPTTPVDPSLYDIVRSVSEAATSRPTTARLRMTRFLLRSILQGGSVRRFYLTGSEAPAYGHKPPVPGTGPAGARHLASSTWDQSGHGYSGHEPTTRTRHPRRRRRHLRSEEHTSELQSHVNLVCRLL